MKLLVRTLSLALLPALLLASACAATPPGPAAAAVPAGTNDAAIFDVFMMQQFSDVHANMLGSAQAIAGAYCLGQIDESTIGALVGTEELHARVLSIEESTCDEVYRDGLSTRADPTSATTLNEAVEIRFERTVWWFDLEEFRAQAQRLCEMRPTRDQFGAYQDDLDMSKSVQSELFGLIESGECDLGDVVG